MPITKPGISDDFLLEKLEDLPPSIWITPEQTGMLLGGRTTGQLAEDRAAGTPPPFGKIGGSIKYRLGDVRAVLNKTYNNTAQVTAAAKDARDKAKSNSKRFKSFATFLNHAEIDDVWPFAIVAGKPIDFFASLQEEIPEESPCRWMTFGEYLTERKASAEAQPTQVEQSKLTPGTKAEQPRKPIVLGKDTM